MSKENEDYTKVSWVGGSLIDIDSGEVLLSQDEVTTGLGKNFEIVEYSGDNLATGISIPSNITKPADYLKGLDEYKFNKSDIKKQMEVCEMMYRYEGIIGSLVDMIVDMANTEIVLQDVDEDSKKILDNFNLTMNKSLSVCSTGVSSFIEQGMMSWMVYGNAFPTKTWKKVGIKGDEKSVWYPNITYLNPLSIDIDTSNLYKGEEKIFIQVDYSTYSEYKSKSPSGGAKRTVKGGVKYGIPVAPDRVTHIKRKPRDWDAWGIPYLVRAFQAVASKKRLRRLDDATTEGLINYLTIFKLGSSDPKSPYHKVGKPRLEAFKSLISSPGASHMLIWPHDVDVVTAGPDGKILDFKDKYAEVDLDILNAFGVIAGIFSSSRASEESLLILIEILESIRDQFIEYMREVYVQILERNKKEVGDIKVSFSNIRVADILQKLKSLVLSYYDRGLLSKETTLGLGGHEFQRELNRKKDETKYDKEGLFNVPNLPFSSKTDENNNMQTRDNGRPSNKMRTEKNIPDNDVKLDKPDKETAINVSKADEFFIGSYLSALQSKYNKIAEDVLAHIDKNGELTENDFDLIMSAGFIGIERYMDKVLKMSYDVFNEEADVDVTDLMYQKLQGWNVFHLNKFKQSLSSIIHKGINLLEGADVDLLIPLVTTAFEKERYRLNLYANEGFIKSKIAGLIEAQARGGAVGGYWETSGDDRVCDTCASKEGNWYKNDELFDVYPSHPNCRCGVNWTDNNPILDNPDVNNTVVLTAPNNPNNPL